MSQDSQTKIETGSRSRNTAIPQIAGGDAESVSEISAQLDFLSVEGEDQPTGETILLPGESAPQKQAVATDASTDASTMDLSSDGMTDDVEYALEDLDMLGDPEEVQPRVEAGAELIKTLEAIPDKMAFKIGEAADMVGVKQYVLRYWETEFDALKPKKSKNGQRVYSRRDVETALMIKKLLYTDRFSIEGARVALKQLKHQVKEEKGIKALAQTQEHMIAKLHALVEDIRRIRVILG